jgi:hypothetical protein
MGSEASSRIPLQQRVKLHREEEEISGEEEMDDTKDYLAEKANEECRVDEVPLIPEGVDEEEALRLAMKASQEQPPPPPPQAPPHYAATVMHTGLSEQEALRAVMAASRVASPPLLWD